MVVCKYLNRLTEPSRPKNGLNTLREWLTSLKLPDKRVYLLITGQFYSVMVVMP